MPILHSILVVLIPLIISGEGYKIYKVGPAKQGGYIICCVGNLAVEKF
jgi:hypothetical protein